VRLRPRDSYSIAPAGLRRRADNLRPEGPRPSADSQRLENPRSSADSQRLEDPRTVPTARGLRTRGAGADNLRLEGLRVARAAPPRS